MTVLTLLPQRCLPSPKWSKRESRKASERPTRRSEPESSLEGDRRSFGWPRRSHLLTVSDGMGEGCQARSRGNGAA
jgi:hypothetical protein